MRFLNKIFVLTHPLLFPLSNRVKEGEIMVSRIIHISFLFFIFTHPLLFPLSNRVKEGEQ